MYRMQENTLCARESPNIYSIAISIPPYPSKAKYLSYTAIHLLSAASLEYYRIRSPARSFVRLTFRTLRAL